MSSNRIKKTLKYASAYAAIPAALTIAIAIDIAMNDHESHSRSSLIAYDCILGVITLAFAAWGAATGKQKADQEAMERLLEGIDLEDGKTDDAIIYPSAKVDTDSSGSVRSAEPSAPTDTQKSRNWLGWLPSLPFNRKSSTPTQETDSTEVQQKTASVSL